MACVLPRCRVRDTRSTLTVVTRFETDAAPLHPVNRERVRHGLQSMVHFSSSGSRMCSSAVVATLGRGDVAMGGPHARAHLLAPIFASVLRATASKPCSKQSWWRSLHTTTHQFYLLPAPRCRRRRPSMQLSSRPTSCRIAATCGSGALRLGGRTVRWWCSVLLRLTTDV